MLLVVSAVTRSAGQQPPPNGLKFEIVSVRALSDKEAADRSPDSIGPNLAVRLRLSCSGQGFYFYAWRDSVVPMGYTVRVTDRGTVWLYGMPGDSEHASSPGLEKLNALVPGAWRLLSGHDRPAVEWELLASTLQAGEKHAYTIFIKFHENDKPQEIFSDTFIVPSNPTPTTR